MCPIVPLNDTLLSDEQFLAVHLLGTSRTFALAIPLLTLERRRQIGLSYLLFRVADSIEDAPQEDVSLKKRLLAGLKDCLDAACDEGSSQSRSTAPPNLSGLWPEHGPTGRLLLEFPQLLDIFKRTPLSVRQTIGKALAATIAGMISFIDNSQNTPNQIQIQTLSELRLYCYVVAGIVGEMLTEVFVCHHDVPQLEHVELRQRATGFGEFLQLINILKDSYQDAASGRLFIPVEASRDSVHELAREGRAEAIKYIHALEKSGFPLDIIQFCRFIYLLADGSLKKLVDHGSGSKLTRDEVMRILADVSTGSSSVSLCL